MTKVYVNITIRCNCKFIYTYLSS